MSMRGGGKLCVVKRRIARKSRSSEKPEAGGPGRPIEFPKPRVAEQVMSETVIFEIGGQRFAMHWSAEIERLPPAGPVRVEQRAETEIGTQQQTLPQLRAALKEKALGLLTDFAGSPIVDPDHLRPAVFLLMVLIAIISMAVKVWRDRG